MFKKYIKREMARNDAYARSTATRPTRLTCPESNPLKNALPREALAVRDVSSSQRPGSGSRSIASEHLQAAFERPHGAVAGCRRTVTRACRICPQYPSDVTCTPSRTSVWYPLADTVTRKTPAAYVLLTKVGRSGSGGTGGSTFRIIVSSTVPSDRRTVTVEVGARPVTASTTVTKTDGASSHKHCPEQAENVVTVAVAANASTPRRRTLASVDVMVHSALQLR